MEPLTPLNVGDLEPFGLERSTPLWYYVLKEAELREDGARLGPVGGRIVAETLIGLLELDPESFLQMQPDWTPTFGTRDFGITDFLSFAGVRRGTTPRESCLPGRSRSRRAGAGARTRD